MADVSDADLFGFDFGEGADAGGARGAPPAPAVPAYAAIPGLGGVTIPGLDGRHDGHGIPGLVSHSGGDAAAPAPHQLAPHEYDAGFEAGDVHISMGEPAEFSVIVDDNVVQPIDLPEHVRSGKFAPRFHTRYTYTRSQAQMAALPVAPPAPASSVVPADSGQEAPAVEPRSVLDDLGLPPAEVDNLLSSVSLPPPKRVILFDIDPDQYTSKPWAHTAADISQWFNYGMTVNTWRAYASRQQRLRKELQARLEEREQAAMEAQRAEAEAAAAAARAPTPAASTMVITRGGVPVVGNNGSSSGGHAQERPPPSTRGADAHAAGAPPAAWGAAGGYDRHAAYPHGDYDRRGGYPDERAWRAPADYAAHPGYAAAAAAYGAAGGSRYDDRRYDDRDYSRGRAYGADDASRNRYSDDRYAPPARDAGPRYPSEGGRGYGAPPYRR